MLYIWQNPQSHPPTLISFSLIGFFFYKHDIYPGMVFCTCLDQRLDSLAWPWPWPEPQDRQKWTLPASLPHPPTLSPAQSSASKALFKTPSALLLPWDLGEKLSFGSKWCTAPQGLSPQTRYPATSPCPGFFAVMSPSIPWEASSHSREHHTTFYLQTPAWRQTPASAAHTCNHSCHKTRLLQILPSLNKTTLIKC